MDKEDIEEAIEVLEDASAQMLMETGDENYYAEAIAVLRQALETEQEPVAWISDSPTKGNGKQLHWTKSEAWRWSSNITPLYTAPPKAAEWFDCTDAQLIDEVRRRGFVIRDAQIDPVKREWVGLTDEEIHDLSYLSQKIDASNSPWFDCLGFYRAVEQALKEKNHG